MKNNFKILMILCLIQYSFICHAQNTFPSTGSVGIGTTSPAISALLDVNSTSKGVLFPRMTFAQRNNIASPVAGLVIYQTNKTKGLYYYNGTSWQQIANSTTGANKTLSNLKPTAINQSLLPGVDSAVDLGYSGKSWKDVYLSGSLVLDGELFMHRYEESSTFLGTFAGQNNTSFASTGIGYVALRNNQAAYNTAIGDEASYNTTTGSGNCSVGYASMYGNTTGGQNCSLGNAAMYLNRAGNWNVGLGTYALYWDTTGSYNVATGGEALWKSLGNYNTAFGHAAGANNVTGNNNLFIGAGADALDTNLTNATAIGYNAKVGISNAIVLGDSVADTKVAIGISDPGNYKLKVVQSGYGINLQNEYGNDWEWYVNGSGDMDLYYNKSNDYLGSFSNTTGAYSSFSDKRMKKNIQPMESMLDMINKLQPVSYIIKTDATNTQRLGFIAQDVQKVFPSFVTHVNDKTRNKDQYLMDYSGFGVIAIKGIQELELQVKEKDDKINDLQAQINELKNMVLSMQKCSPCASSSIQAVNESSVILSNAASLEQNIPNPFDNSTVINYNLPGKFKTAAIIISDNNGKTLKQLSISAAGKGSITVDAATLAAGVYRYSLLVDGKIIGTKQMIHDR